MKLVGTHASIGSKGRGRRTCGPVASVFCEDYYWIFVIINQCKKQSPCFEQLYVCMYIYIYIYVTNLGMYFFVIYQKLRYNTLQVVIMVRNFVVLYGNCGIIWKLWYYGMEVVVFIQFSLYGTLFVQNICPKQFVRNIICPNQIIWKFIYCYYRLRPIQTV